MCKKLTISFFIAVILVIPLSIVYAQNNLDPNLNQIEKIDIKYELINPSDGISYVLKRIKEKVSLFLAFSNESKINNYKKLVNVRLAELKYIVDNKKQAYFEKSTQRYFTAVGEFTFFLTAKNIKSEYGSVKEQFRLHIPVLTELRDKYDSKTAEWRFIEDDINYDKGYINDLSD